MAVAKGFWSYVHADDDAEGGRITRLARDLASQYEMLTGESIELFLDRDDLEWGKDWRASVDGSLSTTAFFIPVLTPRYFLSAECRRELNVFARKAKRLGFEDLVLPILYVDSVAIREEPPSDDAVALVKPFQWEDWTTLRFSASTSPEYRQAVAGMASRLSDANARADESDVSLSVSPDDDEDDSPGFADLMATAESTFPAWSDTMDAIVAAIEEVGEVMSRGSDGLNDPKAQSKGFAWRLTVLRQVATELKRPADAIQEQANTFTSQLNDVDAGFREAIPRIAQEVEGDPSSKDDACEFFGLVRDLATSADEGLGALKEMIDPIQPIEGMSRDLRTPLKTLRRGLTSMYESRKVMNAWVTAIDETGLECGA